MSEGSSKRRLQRALVVLGCALALAGCGGDDDEPARPTRSAQDSGEVSPLRERLERMVTRLLTERGLDPEVSECALSELAATVSAAELDSAIAEIRKTGATPPAVIEAAAAAGRACGRQ